MKTYIAELCNGETFVLRGHGIFRKGEPVAVTEETANILREKEDYRTIAETNERLAIKKFSIVKADSEDQAKAVEAEYKSSVAEEELYNEKGNVTDVIEAKPSYKLPKTESKGSSEAKTNSESTSSKK